MNYYFRRGRRYEIVDGERKCWDISRCTREYFRGESDPVLIDRSLVVLDHRNNGARYGLLESTRIFAGMRLAERSPHRALYEAHARWFAALADEAERFVFDLPTRDWVRKMFPEFENIHAAAAWAAGHDGDPELAARMSPILPLWARLGAFVSEKALQIR